MQRIAPPHPKLESSDILALSERKRALTLPMVTTNHDFRTKFNADLHIFNFIVIKTQGSHQKNRIANLEVCNWSTKLVHLQLSPQSQPVQKPFDLYIDFLWMPGNKGSVHASPRLNRKHKAQAQLKPSPQCRPEHKPFILYEDSLRISFKMLKFIQNWIFPQRITNL